MSDLLIAVVLGIVEGLTEFVPFSSTGHLIVAGHLLGFTGAKADTFEIVIQLGAILAVAVLYWRRVGSLLSLGPGTGVQGRSGVVLLAITTLPALLVGAIVHGVIKDRLFSPATVAIGWGLGGLVLLLVERFRPTVSKSTLEAIRARDALVIGLVQCLALWPSASRSAATISGGMLLGINRQAAAEYSFLAALPVITAATVLDLFSSRDTLVASDLPMFATGFVIAFVTAIVAVPVFVRVLAVSTMRPYGWNRIVAAVVLALSLMVGWLPD